MKKFYYALLALSMMVIFSGCTTGVDPGHVGICKDEKGFANKTILGPGRHSCWGMYEEMHTLETKDSRQTIKIKVLAKDKLNMSFDISMLVSVNTADKELIHKMFTNITPDERRNITIQSVFDTYAKNLIDQEVRKVISTYETTDISDNRAVIITKIRNQVRDSMKGTVIDVKDITINNMDFPDVVTKAQEVKKMREVEIQTEKAEQAKKLLKAQNALEISQIQAAQQLLEAKAVADSNKVISDSITPGYLEYKRIEAMKTMAKKGDLVFMPYNAQDPGLAKHIQNRTFDIKVKERIQNLTPDKK